jgi:hypothetical protein
VTLKIETVDETYVRVSVTGMDPGSVNEEVLDTNQVRDLSERLDKMAAELEDSHE